MAKEKDTKTEGGKVVKYSQVLPVSELETNDGQLDGLPKNPRYISDERFERLKLSLKKSPEFLEANPLKVFRMENGKHIIIAGNMRFLAGTAIGRGDFPCYVFPEGTPVEKLREYTIKDNLSYGSIDWEIINSDWDDDELADWDFEMPDGWQDDPLPGSEEYRQSETEKLSDLKFEDIYYEPKECPTLRLRDCVNVEKMEAKVAALDEYDLTEEQRETLRMFCYRFMKIDFESVANYYAFNAGEEERKAMERLRLVLVDGGIKGFINDDLLKVADGIIDEMEGEQ